MKFTIIFLSFILSISLSESQAQSIERSQIGSLGGEISTASNPMLTHAMGAIASTVIESTNSRIDQGMFLGCDYDAKCYATAIDPAEANWSVSIFPNPTSGQLHLEGEARDVISYELYNYAGQLLQDGFIRNAQLSVTDLPVGMYLLRVYDLQGELSLVQKIIKK